MNATQYRQPRQRLIRALLIFVVAASGGGGGKACGRDSSEVRATYGRGVHAFFARRTSDAERHFTQAVDLGSTDPRVYYFRAMTRLRMGHTAEAEKDMRTGAAYEARDPGNQHQIGMALQRVQGPGRRTLERFRREARLERVQQRRGQTQNRYEQLQRREAAVLHREDPILLEDLVQPSLEIAQPTVDSPAQPRVPPRDDAGTPGLGAPVPAAAPGVFPDPGPQPTAPADAVGEPTAPVSSEAAEEDIFGEFSQPEDDPFGESQAESAGEDATAETNEPAAEFDLFGEDAAPSDSEQPTGEADEAVEDTEDTEQEPAETEDIDELFGSGSIAPPAGELVAAGNEPAVVNPERLFFQLGQLLGSLSNPQQPAAAPIAAAQVAAEQFELGPSTDDRGAVPASAEEPLPTADGDDIFSVEEGEFAAEEGDVDADSLFGSDAVESETAPEETTDDSLDTEADQDELFGDF